MPCYSIDGVTPVVDPTAYVHPSAVLIGDVIVGAGCYIGPCASLRADFGRIEVRAGANIQDTCVVHSFPNRNAVVMDDAEVGEQAIVAACAFVAAGTRLPRRALAVGAPAKVLRELSDDEVARKLEGTRVYQQLAPDPSLNSR